MQLRFRITIWYVPVANRGFDGQVTNLEAKLNESSGTLAGSGVHCWLDPHPRVTTVAKRPQPSRRLPSPATERARDPRKGLRQGEPLPSPLCGRGIFGKRRLPCPVTSGRGIFGKRRLPYPVSSGRGILGKRRLPYPATRGRGILQKALKHRHATQF